MILASGWQLRHRPHSGLAPPRYMPCPAYKKGTDYEYITVHFLRHVNATLLLMNNVDIKVVSAHLCHNDISTTADIYADVLNSMNQKVAQLIDFDLNKLK